jgi:hypothetical protein
MIVRHVNRINGDHGGTMALNRKQPALRSIEHKTTMRRKSK